jgi:hypothetical protein
VPWYCLIIDDPPLAGNVVYAIATFYRKTKRARCGAPFVYKSWLLFFVSFIAVAVLAALLACLLWVSAVFFSKRACTRFTTSLSLFFRVVTVAKLALVV